MEDITLRNQHKSEVSKQQIHHAEEYTKEQMTKI